MATATSNERDPERIDAGPLVLLGWFGKFTDERPVTPHVASVSDVWAVMTTEFDRGVEPDDILALACVEADAEPAKLHRIGVHPDHRREGHATRLVEALHREYGPLALDVRESNDGARAFYEATGWVECGVRPADPEPLIQYEYPDS